MFFLFHKRKFQVIGTSLDRFIEYDLLTLVSFYVLDGDENK
jgi:hypothetical protein